jgi:putative ABC transport system substrate-binding protein
MQRRTFITFLGGAAAWPSIAGAQQPPKISKIGILYPGLASSLPSRIAAFRDGLQAARHREPDNVELVIRSTEGDPTRVAPSAKELAERKVDVIVAVSPAAVHAAQSVSTTIPIVAFDLESDPVADGLINSLSRPGGQITGVFFDFPEFSKKWLELLKQAMPHLTTVAVLWDPATGPMQMKGVEIAGEAMNIKLEILEVRASANVDDSIIAASRKGVDAILMLSSPLFGTNPQHLAGLTLGTSTASRDTISRFCESRRADGLWRNFRKHLSSGFSARSQGIERLQTR